MESADVLTELERLRRENEELRAKSQRLRDAAYHVLAHLDEVGIQWVRRTPFYDMKRALNEWGGNYDRRNATYDHDSYWKRQHDRIDEILGGWANYGHTAMRKFREICHENNKLRKRNERLATENTDLRAALAKTLGEEHHPG